MTSVNTKSLAGIARTETHQVKATAIVCVFLLPSHARLGVPVRKRGAPAGLTTGSFGS